MNKKTTGIAFGVFDGFHEGHKHLLSEAAKLADDLVVVLTPTEASLLLKGRAPRQSYEDRAQAIKSFNPSVTIVPGDATPGTWSVFRGRSEYTVVLGYDQHGIANELGKMNVPFVFASPHKPDIYKSSLLFP